MSLVAYDYGSSDEESDNEDTTEVVQSDAKINKSAGASLPISELNGAKESLAGNISDDEEDFAGTDLELEDLQQANSYNSISLLLPKPKNTDLKPENETEEITLTLSKLPMPKNNTTDQKKQIIEEEDDEFLRKKALPEKVEKPPAKGPVKITIPSLKDFCDVDSDLKNKVKTNSLNSSRTIAKGCGLLSILPQAKSEQNFAKNVVSNNTQTVSKSEDNPSSTTKTKMLSVSSTSTIISRSLIPDTVKNKRPAYNTEGVDGIFNSNKKSSKAPEKQSTSVQGNAEKKLVNVSDSDQSDDEGPGDFFSLNTEQKLPEVSSNEITAMLAKKAAKMADVTNKFLAATAEKEAKEAAALVAQEEEVREAQKRYHEDRLNAEALQALVGSTAKRRRKQVEQIQIMDISSDQVLPDKDEWMRTALASSTEYQPTGVLVDEEPAAGTRRKHQITYLAHKAKANEAELQAMWATNRQNRRATQSKYGF